MVKCRECQTENDDRAFACTKCKASLLPGVLTKRERLTVLGKAAAILIGGGLAGVFMMNLMEFGALAYGTEAKETPEVMRLFGFLFLLGAASAAYATGKRALKTVSVSLGRLGRAGDFVEEGNYSQAVTDTLLALEHEEHAADASTLYGAAMIYSLVKEKASPKEVGRLKQPVEDGLTQLYAESSDEATKRKSAIMLSVMGNPSLLTQMLEQAITDVDGKNTMKKGATAVLSVASDLLQLHTAVSSADFERLTELVTSALNEILQLRDSAFSQAAEEAIKSLSDLPKEDASALETS